MTAPPRNHTGLIHIGGDAYVHPLLEPLLVPIDTLTPWPGNPRRHDQDAINDSVRDHGLYAPINTQASTGRVILGHGRLQALHDLGATQAPALPMDKDDAEARLIVARDNRTHDLGGYDDTDNLALLTAIQNDGGDLDHLLRVNNADLLLMRRRMEAEGAFTETADDMADEFQDCTDAKTLDRVEQFRRCKIVFHDEAAEREFCGATGLEYPLPSSVKWRAKAPADA